MNLKQRLTLGETVNGIMLSELYTPNIARILANCGYDFLLVDCEHGYFDMTQIANLAAVAEGCRLPVIVRVAFENLGAVTKYLDLGARGILLSNVEDASQAAALIEQCLYAPEGDRGVSTFRAHTNYRKGNMTDIMREANQQNLVIAQLESPDAIEKMDEIASLPGLDGVLVGPNDLTQRMHIIGQYQHPRVLSLLQRVRNISAQHGKWSGVITNNLPLLRTCWQMGMTCFSAGSELHALYNGASENYAQLRALQREDDT